MLTCFRNDRQNVTLLDTVMDARKYSTRSGLFKTVSVVATKLYLFNVNTAIRNCIILGILKL